MPLLSWSYGLFFLAVLALFWFVPPGRPRQVVLVASTAIWYLLGVWWHMLAAIAMGATAWSFGRWIASRHPDQRGLPTLLGIAALVGFFVVFRYLGFWDVVAAPGEALPWWVPNPLLAPVGLSFLMFEGISYQADLYLEREERTGSLWSHLVFALYFPTRVIGPMRKYHDFTRQLEEARRPSAALFAEGLGRVCIGIFKKAVLANPLGTFALFNLRPEIIGGDSPLPSILGAYAYWVYLYLDFSGYSDVAIGTSKMLGIDVQENFNHPYRSTTMAEYWQRWHMSLSLYVREYVYTPLAIRWRASVFGPPAGAFASMVVVGLWHGFELKYVAFGVAHGIFLGSYMLYRDKFGRRPWAKRIGRSRVTAFLGWVTVMNLAVWTHVFYGTADFWVAMDWFRGALRIFGGG